MNLPLRPQFWKHYSLAEMSQAEWEALCDGCGMCCLVKLEDEDTQEICYTKVSCKLLDCQTAQCSDYENRKQHVPDCIQLTYENLQQIRWLPSTCAYRRLNEGKKLPTWHYLNTGDRESVMHARKSAAGRCISEIHVDEDDIDEYVVRWVR
ncbi:YcgN family cysteine cluster protein [Acinetobacter sp. 194]|uniref:YcgN family cysteine cluster protein n=1 Tax=Acinetobacter shaoyimingii TaxID=2715164 RepID=UPI00140890B2|nr:YcgN family cysteine cluster protein [Acinetobacter shaoyimingii]NHB59108.1 YcgN family cysteine cluster protein [Acinetobacter shaoyimingii]